jgi:uncharacterized membrane protein YuzA (DUF378 family)
MTALIAHILVIIGGITWGLIGLGTIFGGADWNIIHRIFYMWPMVETLIYVLIGLAAVRAIMPR